MRFSGRSQQFLFSGLVFLLVLLAFGGSLRHGFSPIDDHFLITENLAIRGITWEHLKYIFTTYDPELYIPLTLFSFQVNYVLGGLAPFGFHLANLFLHAANAILVGYLLFLLGMRRSIAFLCAALFAVHPLNTEAVVWIAGRKDVLSTLFTLVSIIFYIHARRGTRSAYVGSLFAFLLALLSKAMAVTLPVLLLLIDTFIERRKISWNILADKIPYALLSALFMVIATAGKERVIGSVTFFETMLMAGRSAMFYVEKFFLPFDLSVFYTHRGTITLSDTRLLVPWLFLAGTLALLLFLTWRRRSVSQNSLLSAAWFGSLFFLITLSPTFLNFQKGAETFVAVDRYAYFPMIGILFFLVSALESLSSKFRNRFITPSILLLLVMLVVPLSIAQTKTWANPELLYANALNVHPESLGARVSLAKYYREQGRLQEAFDVLKAGLPYGDDSHLHLAAGAILARSGRVADAIAEFQKAAAMDPENPEPHYSLGMLEEEIGNFAAAQRAYAEAVRLDASYVIARVRLGELLVKEGKPGEAKLQLEEALRWNPHSLEAHTALGLLLNSVGNFDGALVHLQKAVSLDPHAVPVLLALAEISIAQDDVVEARMYLERVLKVDQRNAEALALRVELSK